MNSISDWQAHMARNSRPARWITSLRVPICTCSEAWIKAWGTPGPPPQFDGEHLPPSMTIADVGFTEVTLEPSRYQHASHDEESQDFDELEVLGIYI